VPQADGATEPHRRREIDMLWTILVILAIIALALFILGQVRGRRRL
jgi:hypothetical protein